MFCAISGEVPEVPVLSPKSRSIFEKKLIVQYIVENKKDPITNEPLEIDDLIEIETPQKYVIPKLPTATSIPQLLLTLQNEWDATALELFNLRKEYQELREELSSALYQNDAAKRVIAKLMIERDEAKTALEKAIK